MSILSDNLRFLRGQKNLSQEKLAEQLCSTRSAYAKYELGTSEPSPNVLLRLGRFYHISIDLLISSDLSKIDMNGLLQLENNRIVLPMKVQQNGENFIEIIPQKAKAGYLSNYSDPEFIESLDHIYLPFLGSGKYRAFPIEGDSMPPHKDGSYIVGRYLERLNQVVDDHTYVILTGSEGIIYKRVQLSGEDLILSSDNDFYKPYKIKISEVLEIWEFASSIATKEAKPGDLGRDRVGEMFSEIQKGLGEIKQVVLKR